MSNASNIMFILSISKYRWRISENGTIVMSGIGTPNQAVAVARAYRLILFGFDDSKILRAA